MGFKTFLLLLMGALMSCSEEVHFATLEKLQDSNRPQAPLPVFDTEEDDDSEENQSSLETIVANPPTQETPVNEPEPAPAIPPTPAPTPPDPLVPANLVVESFSHSGARPVDILFVVDNSTSMEEEQRKMSERFTTFISDLQDVEYQIGITTTDLSSTNFNQDGAIVEFEGSSIKIITPGLVDG